MGKKKTHGQLRQDYYVTAGAAGALVPAWDTAGVVPPRRLGSLLSQSRAAHGMTITEMSELGHGRYSAARLASIERGTTYLDDRSLKSIVDLYGVEVGSLVPERSELVVDLAEGFLRVSDANASVKLHRLAAPDEVLARYLAMVYRMRDIDPGTSVSIRDRDLGVLESVLEISLDDIVGGLDTLMDDVDGRVAWRTRLLRRRFLIPAAGLLVAVCGATALVLAQSNDVLSPVGAHAGPVATQTQPAVTALPPAVRLGPATVQERGPNGNLGPIAVRGN